jgi:probable phosphoglycerate mutase
MIRHAEQLGRPGTYEAERLVELTDRGHEQAVLLSRRLAGEPLACLASSPFQRALQTASYIANTNACEITVSHDLGELLLGQPRSIDSDCETIEEFHARCTRFMEQLVREHSGRRVAAVVHGGVIKMMFLHAFGIPVARAFDFEIKIDHASIFHWRHHERKGRVLWELVVANDTSHLTSRS